MCRNVCFLVLFAISASAMKLNLRNREVRCMIETGISENALNSKDLGILFKNPDTYCYAGCMLRENGLVNKDGTVNPRYIEYVSIFEDSPVFIETLKKCANQTGGNFCETAAKSFECLDVAQARLLTHEEAEEKCRNEVGIPKNSATDRNIRILMNDPNMKCYMWCMMRESREINADGTFDPRFIKSGLKDDPNRNLMFKELDRCVNQKVENVCEMAFKSLRCFNSIVVKNH